MNKFFEKIYDDIIYYEKDFIEVDKKINREIDNLVECYGLQQTETNLEELKSLLYEITRISQREGFFLGTRYALRGFVLFLLS